MSLATLPIEKKLKTDDSGPYWTDQLATAPDKCEKFAQETQ